MHRSSKIIVFCIAASCAWSLNAQAQISRSKKKADAPTRTARPLKVDIRSLQVTKLPRDEFGNGIMPGTDEKVAFWLANSGTAVDLLVKLDRTVVAFDEASSRLIRFADDKGNDLTRSTGGAQINQFFPANKLLVVKLGPSADESGVVLRGYGTPAKGALKLQIHADLAFRVGSDEKKAELKAVDPSPGKQATVGPLHLTFIAPDQFGTPPGLLTEGKAAANSMPVAFQYGPLSKPIKTVIFLNERGESVHTLTAGMFVSEKGGTVSFSMPQTSRVGVQVVYFDKSELVTVPIRLETGLGF
jgi:hypothetical protein